LPRLLEVLWADVPEAAIYKYNYPAASEYEIGISGERLMAAPARDAVRPKKAYQFKFGSLVPSTPNS